MSSPPESHWLDRSGGVPSRHVSREVVSFGVFEGSFGAEARFVSDPEEVSFGSGRGQFILHVATTSSASSSSTRSNY